MNAEDLLRSYKLNIASISYLTKENKSIEVLLQSLTEKEREILVLTYIHKASLAVIQNRMGVNINEIKSIKDICGEKILKVIIETCLLTDEEKIKMCEIVTKSGADFIKTSTGFSSAGATRDDIELFAKHVGENVKIKAAGGISSLEDAEKFIALGASRLGTSRVVKIVKSQG